MTYDFTLNPRAFAAMLAGTKRVEIRVKTAAEPFDYACLAAGDTLRFQNFESGERLAVTLTAAVHYPHIEALLAAEGTEHTLSSTNDPVKGAASVRSFAGYAEGMLKNGCWALRFENARAL